MDIASHMEKVARMDAVHRRLDREADFELWYWMALDAGNQAMNAALHASGITAEEPELASQVMALDAGNQAMNAALHASGITAEEPELASQVNDIYMRQTDSGGWERVVKRGADIIHPQMSEFDKPVPAALQEAIEALHTLESYRDPCIRLGKEVTPKIIEACDAAYEKVLSITREAVASPGGAS